MSDEIDRYGLSAQFTFLASGKTITSLQAVVEHLRQLEQAVEAASQAVKRSGLGTTLNQVANQTSQASQRINHSLNAVQQATQKAGKTSGLKDLRAEFRTLRAEAKAIDLSNLTQPQQVGQATQALNHYIAELKRLESQLDKTTLEGREMAAQLQQQQQAAHRQIQKIATVAQQAQTQTQKGVQGIRAEFRALRAEANNIDFGDLTDPDQFKAATHAIDQYIQELKRLEAQVDKTTLEGREMAANLQRQQTIASNRSQMAGAERKAAIAQQRIGAAQAVQTTGAGVVDFFQEPRAAAIEFSQQLAEINKLADFGAQDSTAGMQTITRSILEQSTGLATASDELAAVYGNLAGAGKSFANTEIIKAEADAILKNALALDISSDAATSLDIKLGSIYKNSLDSMGGIVKMNERMGSSFNALADNLPDVKIDAQGITDVFNVLVATVGDAKNFRPPDLSAFSAIMNSLEVTPDVAGSFVGRFDAAIAKKTDQFAQTLGMPLQKFRHMVDTDKFGVYQAVAKRYATMKGGDIEKANFLKSIGIDSSEDQKIIKGMATQLTQMTDARRIANQAYKEATSTTTELNKVQKSGAFQTEKAQIAAENMKKALGLAINEALLPITTLTATLLEKLIKFTQDNPKLVGTIATTVYVLGGLAAVAGAVGLAFFGIQSAMAQAELGLVLMAGKGVPLTGFFANTMAAFQGGGIIAGFGELGTAIMASGQAIAAFATGPVGLAIAAFAAIIALLEILTPGFNVLGGMIGVVLSPLALAFGAIKGVVKGLAIAFKPLMKQFQSAGGDGKYLGEVMKTAIAIFKQFAGTGEAVGKVVGLVLGVVIATPLRLLVTMFKGLVGILQTVGWVGQWLATPFTWAVSMITTAWQGFVNWFSNMPLVKFAMDLAQGLINALNHNPTERIPEAWETAIAWIQETFGFLLNAAQTVGNVLVSILDPTRLFKGILSGLISLVEGAVTTIQESGIGKLFDRMGMGAPLDAVAAGLDHLKAQLTDQPVTVPVEVVPTSDRPDSFLQRLVPRRKQTAIAPADATLPPMPPPTAGATALTTAIPAETILPVAQIQAEVAMTAAVVQSGMTAIQAQWRDTWQLLDFGANFSDLVQPAIAELQTQLGIAGQALWQFVSDSATAMQSLDFTHPQQSAIALGDTLLGVLKASGSAFGSLTLSAVTLGVFSLASLSPIVLVMGGIVLAAIAVATNFLGIRSAILGIVKMVRGMINVVRGGIELIQALITTIINAGRGIIQIFNGIPSILRGDFSQIRAGWDTLTSAFQVGGKQIQQAMGRMGMGVRQIFSGAFQVVHGLIDGLIRAVRDAGKLIKLAFKGGTLAIQGLGLALGIAKRGFVALLGLPKQLQTRWQQMRGVLAAPVFQAAIAQVRTVGKTLGRMVQGARSQWQQMQSLDDVPILGSAIRQIRRIPSVVKAGVEGAQAIWRQVTQLDEVPILRGAIATFKQVPDVVQSVFHTILGIWKRLTELDNVPILQGAIAQFKRVPDIVQGVVQSLMATWKRVTELDQIPVVASAIATFKQIPDQVQKTVQAVTTAWHRITDLDNLPILTGAIAAFRRIPEIVQGTVQAITGTWKRVTELDQIPVVASAIATFKRIPEIVQGVVQSLTDTWHRITDLDSIPVLQGVVQFVKTLPELFSGAIAQIKQLWGGLGEKVTSVFGFMKGKSKQTGEEMVSNLAENSPGPTYQIRMKWALTAEAIHAKLQTLSGQAQAAGQEMATHLESSFNQVQATAKTKLGKVGAHLQAGLSGKGAGAVSRSLGSVGMVASNFAPQLAAPLFVVNDLIDASQSLSESLPEAKKFFVGLLPKVTKLSGGMTKLLPLAMTGFSALGGVLSAIAPIATAAFAAITGPLLPIIAGVVAVVAAIWLLRPVFKAVFGIAGSILKGIVGTIAAIAEGISTLASTITSTLAAPFQLLEGGVKRLFGRGGDQPTPESSGKSAPLFSAPAIAPEVATPYFPEPDYGQVPKSRYAVTDWMAPMPARTTAPAIADPVPAPMAAEIKAPHFPEPDYGQVPVSRYASPLPDPVTVPVVASPVTASVAPVVQTMQTQVDARPVSVAVVPEIATMPLASPSAVNTGTQAIALPLTVDPQPAQQQSRHFFAQVQQAWSGLVKDFSLEQPFQSAIAVGGNLLTQLQSVGHQFGSLTLSAVGFGVVSLTSLSPLVLVLGGIALAAIAVATNFLGIRDVIAGLVKLVKGLVKVVASGFEAIAALSQLILDVGRGIIRVFAAIPNALRGDFSQISAAWDETMTAIRSGLSRLGQAFDGMVQGVKQVFAGGFEAIAGLVQGVVKALQGLLRLLGGLGRGADQSLAGVRSGFAAIPTVVEQVVGTITTIWKRITTLDELPILQGAIATFKRIPEIVQGTVQAIATTWKRVAELDQSPVVAGAIATFKRIPEIVQGVVQAIAATWHRITDLDSIPVLQGVVQFVKTLPELFSGAIAQIKQLWGGLGEKVTSVFGFMKGKSKQTGEEMISNLAENSPGPTYQIRMKWGITAENIHAKLQALSGQAQAAGQEMATHLESSFNQVQATAKTKLGKVGAHLKAGLSGKGAGAVSQSLGSVGMVLSNFAPQLAAPLFVMNDVIDASQSLSESLPEAKKFFTGLGTAAKTSGGMLAKVIPMLSSGVSLVGGVIATVLPLLSSGFAAIAAGMSALLPIATAVFAAITGPLLPIVLGVGAIIAALFLLRPVVKAVFGLMSTLVSGVVSTIQSVIGTLANLGSAIAQPFKLLKQGWTALFGKKVAPTPAESSGTSTPTNSKSRESAAPSVPELLPTGSAPVSRYSLDASPFPTVGTVSSRPVASGAPSVDLGSTPRSRYADAAVPDWTPMDAPARSQGADVATLNVPKSRYAMDLPPMAIAASPQSASIPTMPAAPSASMGAMPVAAPASPQSRYSLETAPFPDLPPVTIPATVAIPAGAIATQVQGVQAQMQDQTVAIAADVVPTANPVALPIVPEVASIQPATAVPAATIGVTLETATATTQAQTLWTQLQGGVQAVGAVAISTFAQMTQQAIAFGFTSMLSISPVILVLGAVVLAAIALATNFLGLRTIVLGVGRVVQGVFQIAIAWIRGVGQIIQGLVTIVRGVTAAIRGDFSGLRQGVGQIFAGIRTIFSGTITGFQTAFSGAIQVVQGLFQGLRQVVSAVGGSVQGIGAVLSAAISLPMAAWQGFLDLLKKIQAKIDTVVAAVQNSPVGKMANAVGIRMGGKAGTMAEANQLADFDQRLGATPPTPTAAPQKPGFLGRLFGRKAAPDPALAEFDQRLAATPAVSPSPIPNPVPPEATRPRRRGIFHRREAEQPPKSEKTKPKTQVEQAESAKSAASGLANVASLVAPSLAAPIMAVQLLGDSFSAIAKGLPDLGRLIWQTIPAFFGVGAAAGQSGAALLWANVQAKAAMVGNALLAGANWLLSGSFATMATAAIAAWGAILAPILPIVGAIAAVVGAIALLKAAFDFNFLGIRDLFVAVWDGFQAIVGEVVQSALAVFTPFVEMGQAIAATFMSAFASVGEAIAPIFSLFGGGGKGGGLGMLVSVILLPVRLIAENLKVVFGVLATIARIVTAVLTPAFKVLAVPIQAIAFLIRMVVGTISGVVTGIQTLIQGIVSAMGSVFSFIYSLIPAPIRWIIENIGSGIQAVVGWLTNSTPATPVQKFASGGTVQGQGSPTGDRVPILSSPGEFVVNAAAARNHYPELQQLNDTGELAVAPMPVPIPFQAPTFAPSAPNAPGSTREPEVHVHLNFAAGAIVVNGDNAQQVANDLIYELTPQFQYLVREALRDLVDKMK